MNCRFLNKDHTNVLRAFAILMIMLHHAYQKGAAFLWMYPFNYLGYTGVAVFLLLSGFALGESFKRKQNYTKNFFLKKFFRLYLTFAVSYAVLLIGEFFLQMPVQGGDILANMLTMSYPNQVLWYLKVQLLMYLLFYILYRFVNFKSEKVRLAVLFLLTAVYIAVMAVLRMEAFWYYTVLYFPIGMFISDYKNQVQRILNKFNKFLVLSICLLLFVMVIGMYYFFGTMGFGFIIDTVFTASNVFFLLFLSSFLCFHSRILSCIGTVSLELYLSNLVILSTVYQGMIPMHSWWGLALYVVFSFAAAACIRFCEVKILRLVSYVISRRRKQ